MTEVKDSPRAPGPQNRRTILLLSLGHFANDTYPGFLAPLQPLLMQQANYGLTLAGLLTSIASISGSIMQTVFGFWSDRMRRPWLVIFGPLITALLFGTIGWWHNWYALAAVILIGGLGTAAFHPQAAAMSGKAGSKRSGLAMSLFVTGGNAGHAVGPLIILSVVSLWGLRYSMVTAVLGIGVALLLWRKLPHSIQRTEAAERTPFTWSKITSGRLGSLALIWLVVVIRAFVVSGFMTFCPIYLTDKGYSILIAGSANTLFELSGAFGSILGGALSDRIGRKVVIVISMAGAFPAFWLFLHSGSIVGVIALAAAGFFIYSSISVNIVMGQDLFPRQAGAISSLMMGMGWGIGGLAVTPLGAVAEKIGVGSALQALIYVTLAGLVIALFIPAGKAVTPEPAPVISGSGGSGNTV
jgi:FSR family fosmidomycin resistance protein-like MFS transporter